MAQSTFEAMYPRSAALQLKPVNSGTGDHDGFDGLEVEAAVGAERFATLMEQIANAGGSVFCCDHRKYPAGHALAGYEVHCIWAHDLEKFLEAAHA